MLYLKYKELQNKKELRKLYKLTDIFYNPPIELGTFTIEELKVKAEDLAQIIYEGNLDFTIPVFNTNKPNEIINFMLKYGKYKISEV